MENVMMQFFNRWVESQEKFIESWVQTTKSLPQTLQAMEPFKNVFPYPAGNVNADLYLSWLNELVGSSTAMQGLDRDVIADTLLKMAGNSDVYKKFSETWLPIFQAAQGRVSEFDNYTALLDPVKYKEVVDTLFRFNADVVTEFIEHASRITETLGFSAMEFERPWANAIQKNIRYSPELFDGRADVFLKAFHNLFNAFDNTFGKVFHIPAVGKDREKIDLLLRSFDDLAVFLAKNVEYQHRVYVTAIKAVGMVLEEIAGKIKSGEDIKTFDELFNLWIDVNEREFFDLFKTDEFSRMQGDLLDAYLKVRRHFQKLMELYLFELPVALRSEMDDVYKTVYDLKKKVRKLEKQMNHVNAKEAEV